MSSKQKAVVQAMLSGSSRLIFCRTSAKGESDTDVVGAAWGLCTPHSSYTPKPCDMAVDD